MWFGRSPILKILDAAATAFTFPGLDNGYVYLAATRLSAFRSASDWALVIEVFGFSPRAGLPDTSIYTFASRLRDRNTPDSYVSRQAYENYLARNPNNEFRSVYPIAEGNWQDDENAELVAAEAPAVEVRGSAVALPDLAWFSRHGIDLEEPPRVRVFELCRYLAATNRDAVLATDEERRASVPADLQQIMQFEEWHHPDVAGGELPSQTRTFRQLTAVLETGDVTSYAPDESPNTHWRHWPEGGLL